MPAPQLLTWQTVLRWTAGVIVFIILMTEFWGHGYLIFTPVIALAAFRFRLILEPRWSFEKELERILRG